MSEAIRLAENKIERGYQADQLMQNSLLNETLQKLESAYIKAWRESKSLEAREDAHRYVTLIDRLRADIRGVATTGDLERNRVAELERRSTYPWRVR